MARTMRLDPQFSRRALRTSVAVALTALVYTQWKQWYGLGSIAFITGAAASGGLLGTIYHVARYRISRRRIQVESPGAEIFEFPAKWLDKCA
jgi:hypothetical protein